MSYRRRATWKERVRIARSTDIYELAASLTPMQENRGRRYIRGTVHDSLVVDTRRNTFFHNSMGVYGGTIDLVLHLMFRVNPRVASKDQFVRAVDWLYERVATNTLPRRRESDISNSPTPCHAMEPSENDSLHSRLMSDNRGKEWWIGRGINIRTMVSCRLGCDDVSGTIPIYDPLNGWRLSQIKHRAFEKSGHRLYGPNSKPIRYWGHRKGLCWPLFVPDRTILDRPTIYFVSGEIKAMVCWQNGIPAVTSTSGVNSWSDEWGILLGESHVFVVVDPGEERAQEQVVAAMRRSGVMATPSMRLKGDIDELLIAGATKEEVLDAIHGTSGRAYPGEGGQGHG